MKKDQTKYEIDKDEVVISIKGLYKSFGELEVLKGIDLDVFKGENVAVLGKSGSGKSVLIKIIAGLLKSDKGEITILDKQLSQLHGKALDELRLHLGFSFQSSALYDSMSVYQNLAFPLTMNVKNITRKQVDDAVEDALDAVGLLNKIKELPAELSGGQRKRLGIARTLILKPEIILYDEPTSGLDPITCEEINTLINEVQQRYKTSAVIITHDLTCAKNTCNRLAMLIDGVFPKIGTFEEVHASEDENIKKFFAYNFM